MTLLLFALGCQNPTLWPEAPPPTPCAAGALPAGESLLRLAHAGKQRAGLVWAPRAAGPRDLVVNLHEHRSEPRRQAHYSGWVAAAEALGMLLLAPDGSSSTWNAGGGCCGKAAEKDAKDADFLEFAAERVATTGCASGRVLATGIGNGAMMAHRWACSSNTVDAVISVGGALQLDDCPVARPIPVVHYHGDQDQLYPLSGGSAFDHGQGSPRPEADALAAWKARNRVHGAPVRHEQGALRCDRWTGDAPLVWCTVVGMADLWPGAAGWPADPGDPLSDATQGAFTSVVRPYWDAHPNPTP